MTKNRPCARAVHRGWRLL